jgi:hypothetical protein
MKEVYDLDKLLVQTFVDEVLERADDVRGKTDDLICAGEQIAYAAVLTMLQRILLAESPDAPVEHNVGFDVDARVINGEFKQLEWA